LIVDRWSLIVDRWTLNVELFALTLDKTQHSHVTGRDMIRRAEGVNRNTQKFQELTMNSILWKRVYRWTIVSNSRLYTSIPRHGDILSASIFIRIKNRILLKRVICLNYSL
jgi:hypothetical protein